MRTRVSRPGLSRSRWAAAARLGQAHWLFGNLYEAMVDVPRLLADAQPQRAPRLLGPGSPVRYFVPAGPMTLAATTVALVEGWRSGGDRRVIVTAAAGTATASVLSAYLIRTVSVRLLRGGPLGATERRRLVRTWHRVNLVRMVALAVASAAMRAPARPGVLTS